MPVDIARLVSRVLIAPSAPQWFAELVSKVLTRYALAKAVEQSSLDARPIF
jgi:hypothetical protein